MPPSEQHRTLPASRAFRADAGSRAEALDRAAIELGRVDSLASVRPGWFARTRTVLIGAGRNYALADPRLEALRRYAVTYRRLGAAVLQASNDAPSGLTVEEERTVRDVVDTWRPPLPRPDHQRWLAPMALALAAVCLVGNALW